MIKTLTMTQYAYTCLTSKASLYRTTWVRGTAAHPISLQWLGSRDGLHPPLLAMVAVGHGVRTGERQCQGGRCALQVTPMLRDSAERRMEARELALGEEQKGTCEFCPCGLF